MTVKEVRDLINGMVRYSNVLDMMHNNDWWADLDDESASILMCLSTDLIDGANMVHELLDNSRLESGVR